MWISKKRYKNLIVVIAESREIIRHHEQLISDLKKYNQSLKIANSSLENCLYGNNIKYPNSEVHKHD